MSISNEKNFVYSSTCRNRDRQILEIDEENQSAKANDYIEIYLNINGKIIQFEIFEKNPFYFSHFINHRCVNSIVDNFMPNIVFHISHGIINIQERIPEFIRIETIDILHKKKSFLSMANVVLFRMTYRSF